MTRRAWSLVLVSVAVAAVSLAVALAALLLRPEPPDDDALREAALAAARERTTALTTYDHRTLDEDFAAVLETATGEFEQEYRATTARLRDAFRRSQAVAAAKVVGAGLERVEDPADAPARAVAVVAVDQVIRTAGAPARTERNRLRMELLRSEGTWLVSRVQRL